MAFRSDRRNYALFPHLSARDNITFGLRARRHPKDDIARRLAEVAELLEMTPFLDRRPRQLSGSQRQRVALARALVRRPRVLLMDEPLSNVDALLRDRMRAELREFHERAGVTTVYVTHDQREAMGMSDRLMVLADGHVHQIGRPLEVFRRPTTAFAARFLGSPGTNLWPMTVEVYPTTGGPNGHRSATVPHRQQPAPRAANTPIIAAWDPHSCRKTHF